MTGIHSGVSATGRNGGEATRGASDNVVLFDRQYVWPGDLTEIPDWVYTDENIYEREVERIFHGPTWNYVALEAEIPNAGDFIRSNVGPTPVVVARAEDGSINVFENRCVHRAAEYLPRAERHDQGVRLPLSPMDLQISKAISSACRSGAASPARAACRADFRSRRATACAS